MRQGQDRAFARYLRKNSTDAERILWRHIRAKQIHGFRFRRQVQIGAYFADFVCLEARLVVEVDGGQHNERETDAIRDQPCGRSSPLPRLRGRARVGARDADAYGWASAELFALAIGSGR